MKKFVFIPTYNVIGIGFLTWLKTIISILSASTSWWSLRSMLVAPLYNYKLSPTVQLREFLIPHDLVADDAFAKRPNIVKPIRHHDGAARVQLPPELCTPHHREHVGNNVDNSELITRESIRGTLHCIRYNNTFTKEFLLIPFHFTFLLVF